MENSKAKRAHVLVVIIHVYTAIEKEQIFVMEDCHQGISILI
jgi:hypothetical protein